MNILHVVSTYPPYRGGMGTVAWEEATRLARLGHTVHVATVARRGQSAEAYSEDGVMVHRIMAVIGYGHAGLCPWIMRLMREPWDVIHLHAPFFGVQELAVALMWLGWRPKRLLGT